MNDRVFIIIGGRVFLYCSRDLVPRSGNLDMLPRSACLAQCTLDLWTPGDPWSLVFG